MPELAEPSGFVAFHSAQKAQAIAQQQEVAFYRWDTASANEFEHALRVSTQSEL